MLWIPGSHTKEFHEDLYLVSSIFLLSRDTAPFRGSRSPPVADFCSFLIIHGVSEPNWKNSPSQQRLGGENPSTDFQLIFGCLNTPSTIAPGLSGPNDNTDMEGITEGNQQDDIPSSRCRDCITALLD